ncbi:MAG: DNA primase [Proteobacteria bacterium]|nr:DNA primase [Pseudomonadota bacterium]
MARCPAHKDRNASLSVAEGSDGRVLVKCFAGCDVLAIVHAVGLEVADLFPERIADRSPEGRVAQREAYRQSGWVAALGVLTREATIVAIVAGDVAAGRVPSDEYLTRLRLAIERIESAREVLA